MYAVKNFKTKKELKQAVAAGEKIFVYQPGPWGGELFVPEGTSIVYLEGPHFPSPHNWYAKATLHNGVIVKVV